ncbi:MAG: hypothetical protein VR65_20525 [Desulfobulbaceae bacterium BRH_c16a]|nr:MAG: hypothetical protein VR65_20525 [Desulfobulbaceae bacterium BRH_c16a]
MNDLVLQVVLQRCAVYEQSAIKAIVETAMSALAESNFHGKTVLLKPNLISGGVGLACTHPQFIAAVAACFLDCGARVRLGDSPAFGSAERVCRKLGITQALQGMDVRFVEFSTPVRKRLAGGVTVTVAQEALDCDLLVGLPKVKAHNQMYVTLGVKNIFGVVSGVNKAMLHMVHGNSHSNFAGIILDLLDILPAQLHLADGVLAMHISGPLDGSPLPLACIAAAKSPVAMDTALLQALELDPRQSPLSQEAAARKLVGSEGGDIVCPILLPQHFHGSGFIAPMDLDKVRFNPFRFWRGMMKRFMLKIRP